jgi:hypothetical protein
MRIFKEYGDKNVVNQTDARQLRRNWIFLSEKHAKLSHVLRLENDFLRKQKELPLSEPPKMRMRISKTCVTLPKEHLRGLLSQ